MFNTVFSKVFIITLDFNTVSNIVFILSDTWRGLNNVKILISVQHTLVFNTVFIMILGFDAVVTMLKTLLKTSV